MKFRRLSLLWKIWLSTSVALTGLFAVTGLLLQRHAVQTTARSVAEEGKASFQAYTSLWQERAESLAAVSSLLSSMPNVRAAFGLRDPATIRDTAREVWSRISDRLKETAFFVVTDPRGAPIASLDPASPRTPSDWPVVRAVFPRFPRQVSGFFVHGDELFQLVITPVYVDSARGPALINVLVVGYTVNHLVAQRLKESTGGSEFLFLSRGRVFASTLNDRATGVLSAAIEGAPALDLVSDGVSEYVPLVRDLVDLEAKPLGTLAIFRSFEGARTRLADLRRELIVIWLLSVLGGLAATWVLARRIVRPVEQLDRAATEVARQNYDYRVSVHSQDELGRLASTFNTMCASLQSARQELIRQERISTIGRLASSIVHDLRNPLAAIYGGSEMLVDTELSGGQTRRLAANIYQASRRIQALLQDLVNVSRGKSAGSELCPLRDVVEAAVESQRATADSQQVAIQVDVPEDIELQLERARVERVFINLIGNALEAMPGGGRLRISVRAEGTSALVEVSDTGPGISDEIRHQLFQPFFTFGKKNGLGLGLALARQTLLDHGGDLWVSPEPGPGARFCLRFPRLVPGPSSVATPDAAVHPSTR